MSDTQTTEHVAYCMNCGRGLNEGDAMCCPISKERSGE